ncbi:RmlC-like cupin domain-containing protein [Suillus discolor]|uniref:RmlC-like cupin domain-containing protein n=1 Tax=Suillus discolor TaxID=1912936 RepID=A0A9P7F8H0_9AGAM|nr:RmlC-like cupin domain-containing protein [Suillus discolor]KAG2108962.1 RmlC-like cupin domain-containing protein [Suillus discolor]
MTDGHVRLQSANYPTSTELAGVDMRFDEEAVRELHRHREMEWVYMPLLGGCRCTILDDGGAHEANLTKRNIWYAPKGQPHSIQGVSKEDKTFLLSNWLAHMPKEVMAKNYGLDPSVFDKLSQKGDEPDDSKSIFFGGHA